MLAVAAVVVIADWDLLVLVELVVVVLDLVVVLLLQVL